ncbi:hypothetical protein ACFFMO_01270 [Lederbergia wuyishanensis]
MIRKISSEAQGLEIIGINVQKDEQGKYIVQDYVPFVRTVKNTIISYKKNQICVPCRLLKNILIT